MKVKNVVILNDFAFINGGAASVAFASAKALAKQGLNVVVFSAVPPIDESLSFAGVKVICTNQKDILHDSNRLRAVCQGVWNVKAQKELRVLLSSFDPSDTVVHMHGIVKCLSPSVLSVLRHFNFSVVYTLHDFFPYCPNGGFYDYKKQCICEVKPMSGRCLFCNCDSRGYVQKLWRIARQIVLNYQFRKLLPKMTLVSISELSDRIARKQFGDKTRIVRINNPIEEPSAVTLNENRNVYLFMARLSSEKGLDLFCKSISDMSLKGVVLGGGNLLEQYKKEYPNIEFAGWQTGAYKLSFIQRTKCLVFPSKWYETFGLAPMEMLSYGIPCIVPDRCAASEFIVDGVNGFVFQTGNVMSLKKAIAKIEAGKLNTTTEQIRRSIDLNAYSLKTHSDSLVRLYNTIVKTL